MVQSILIRRVAEGEQAMSAGPTRLPIPPVGCRDRLARDHVKRQWVRSPCPLCRGDRGSEVNPKGTDDELSEPATKASVASLWRDRARRGTVLKRLADML